jgi:hypothetical protein
VRKQENLCSVVIHDDQETWRGRIGTGGGLRRKLGRQSGLREEMPNLEHLGARKILAVGSAHDVPFAGDLELKLSAGLLLGLANLPDQPHDIAPFKIMSQRMAKYCFERTAVRPRYG